MAVRKTAGRLVGRIVPHRKNSSLLRRDYSERSGVVVVGTGGEIEAVVWTVVCRATAKLNPPKLVDTDCRATLRQCGDVLARHAIEAVDRSAIRVVRDQQGVAQCSKVPGSHGEAPRLVQRRALRKTLQEYSAFAVDIDIAARTAR